MSEYLTNIRKWRPGDQPLHGPAGHDVTMSRGSVGTPHPAPSACSIHREVAILMSMAACVTTPPARRDAQSAKYIGIN